MSPTSQGVVAVAVILTSLSTVAVGTRFYVRLKKRIQLKSDDWTILVALILTWILSVLLIVGSAMGGIGGHTKVDKTTGHDIITSKEPIAVKIEFSYFLVLTLTLGMIKMSVLLMYRRLFLGTLFSRYSLLMCVVIVLFSLSFFFAFAFQCRTNIQNWWTSVETIERYCDNTGAIDFGFVIADVLTDIMILVIPIPIVWRLQLSTPQRIGLIGIFLLGTIATAAGVARMVIVTLDDLDTNTGFRDLRGLITNILIWGQVEASIAVVAACLPTLRPLFHGKSPESLIGSIRSMLSLNSTGRWRLGDRKASDNDAFASSDGVHLQIFHPSMETQDARDDGTHVPKNKTAMKTGISVNEEHV